MICKVLAVNTASKRMDGHDPCVTSSSTGAGVFANAASSSHARIPGRCSARSEHCHCNQGIAAAKCTACWPVPLPISSTLRVLAKCTRNTSRIGSRLREEGLTVIGFGEEKTPRPFVAACDKFIYIELLREEVIAAASAEQTLDAPAQSDVAKPAAAETPKRPKAPIGFIAKILDDIADEDGWVHLGALGTNITKLRPEFDPRTYGYKKLSDLIKGYSHAFELQARAAAGGPAVLYARHKQNGK